MSALKSNRRQFVKAGARGALGLTAVGAWSASILGANDRIRIGLIGCGSRGNYLLDRVLHSASELNVEIAALCDVWRLNLTTTMEKLNQGQETKPSTFSRYGDLLQLNDIDAVIIATPDFAHTPILIEAAGSGKDAYVEKPMATRLEHANEALEVVRSKKTVVQVGTQRRSEVRYQRGAQLIQSGLLGHVSEIEAAWHDSKPRWARDFSDVRKEDVDWSQYLMDLPPEPFRPERFRRWHLYKDFTVGTPGLLGSHLIDVATWFMDDPLPTSAVAHGGVYVWKDGREHADTLDCIIEYPKGFIVNYSTRLGNQYPVPQRENRPLPTTFYGTRGTFDTHTWTARGLGGGEDALKDEVKVPPADDTDENHVRNWLECLRTRQTPTASIEAGYAHSVASIMCFKAWQSGQRQCFDAKTRRITAG